jgi:hypothetical protein
LNPVAVASAADEDPDSKVDEGSTHDDDEEAEGEADAAT